MSGDGSLPLGVTQEDEVCEVCGEVEDYELAKQRNAEVCSCQRCDSCGERLDRCPHSDHAYDPVLERHACCDSRVCRCQCKDTGVWGYFEYAGGRYCEGCWDAMSGR